MATPYLLPSASKTENETCCANHKRVLHLHVASQQLNRLEVCVPVHGGCTYPSCPTD